MKYKKSFKYAILPILLIAVIAYYANKITFYNFDDSIGNFQINLQKTTNSTVNGQMLWFTYDEGKIDLNLNPLLDSSAISIYSLTSEGTIPVEMHKSQKLNGTGTLFAIAPPCQFDVNSDGVTDTVYVSAKTDTIPTQDQMIPPVNTKLSDQKLPFEAVFTKQSIVTLFYKNELLANQKVIINTAGLKNRVMTTDINGVLPSLDLRDIRKGFSLLYQDEKGLYYNLSYQVEDNTLFTSRHLAAMQPFFKVVMISGAVILLLVTLRIFGILKTRLKHRGSKVRFAEPIPHFKYILCNIGKSIRSIRLSFSLIRWLCMIVFFLIFVFGIHFFGRRITDVGVPTLACPRNQDQFIVSPCFMLCHLNILLMEGLPYVIGFIITNVLIIIIFGRTLCGFVCPFGLIQDIIYKLRNALKINSIPINEKIYNILAIIKWFLLIVFFSVTFLGINFCDFCPAIITTAAFSGFKLNLVINGFVAVFFLVASFFKRRFWCNICPFGYFLGLFSKISLFRIRKDTQACTECGACYEACPMGIKNIYSERKKENVTTHDCIMCGACIESCPETNALSMAVMKKKFYISSRFKFFGKKRKSEAIEIPLLLNKKGGKKNAAGNRAKKRRTA
jgi:polyferredoxin